MSNPVKDFFQGAKESIADGIPAAAKTFKKIFVTTIPGFTLVGSMAGYIAGNLLFGTGIGFFGSIAVASSISAVAGASIMLLSALAGLSGKKSFSKKLGGLAAVPLLAAAVTASTFGAVAGYKQVDKMINPPKKVSFDIESRAEFNKAAEHNKGFDLLEQSQASVQKNHQNKITLG